MGIPFSVNDDAKQWLRSLPTGLVRTWEEMTRKSLDKYFSSTKTGKFRREIRNIFQKDTETDFWDGLTPASRRTLSNVDGGPLRKMTSEEIVTILDDLSEDANQWPSESAKRRISTGVHLVDANISVQVQLDAMDKEIRKLTIASIQKVLSQMPFYAKFLKEILTKKRKIEETAVVKLTEHCSVILQNKLPPKKLEMEIGEIRSVPISLQLADQKTLIPEGIVQDVLVRVDKFVFPVDFIVVNMEKNKEIPLILGRPFLAMGRAIVDIHERKLMLRVGAEKVTFDMNVEKGEQKEKPAVSMLHHEAFLRIREKHDVEVRSLTEKSDSYKLLSEKLRADLTATQEEHEEMAEQVFRIFHDSEDEKEITTNDPILQVRQRIEQIRRLNSHVDGLLAEAEEFKKSMDILASKKKAVQAQLELSDAQLRSTKENASGLIEKMKELQHQLDLAISDKVGLANELEVARSEVIEANKRVDAKLAQFGEKNSRRSVPRASMLGPRLKLPGRRRPWLESWPFLKRTPIT
ncbi:uncharacterized protein [Nicotiana tomentosiformis]|uniref:uncharacterized protein n=1 Tax=Nicotiana tomentosiformis TaxID=4098 RepID=UPI00388CE56F